MRWEPAARQLRTDIPVFVAGVAVAGVIAGLVTQVAAGAARKTVARVAEAAVVGWPGVPRQAVARVAEAAVVGRPGLPRQAVARVTRTAAITCALAVIRAPGMAATTRPLPLARPTEPRVPEAAVDVVTPEPTAAAETAEHASRSRAHLHDRLLHSPYRRHYDDISPSDRRQPTPPRRQRTEEAKPDLKPRT
ncbi:hypothetical protein [Amycolatopsis sp. RTGN1]|uniref:hypothetical protein n=1 Tax=Amycolatopsis ponsaeliensis TaxID=2992142 RepID=UPI00254DF423|nr:hypothetical protein [Amycolatopsis sp. RTGN1]